MYNYIQNINSTQLGRFITIDNDATADIIDVIRRLTNRDLGLIKSVINICSMTVVMNVIAMISNIAETMPINIIRYF